MNINKLLADNAALRKKVLHLENLLDTDALTGAKSARSFFRVCDRRELIEHQLVTAFDLRNFGDYNKRFGHHAGDEILKKFVNKLKVVFRNSDDIYRRGGDEFVTILNTSKNLTDTKEIKERLTDAKIANIAYIGFASGQEPTQELVIRAFAEVEKQKRFK